MEILDFQMFKLQKFEFECVKPTILLHFFFVANYPCHLMKLKKQHFDTSNYNNVDDCRKLNLISKMKNAFNKHFGCGYRCDIRMFLNIQRK